MKLQEGDTIFVTDEDLSGRVTRFTESTVSFLCKDGFDYTFPIHQVYLVNKEGKVENENQKFRAESAPKLKAKATSNSLTFDVKNPVFDLHIEQLNPLLVNAPDYEIVQYQILSVKEILFIAHRKRVRQITLIHGVGKGKLRREIRNLLSDSYPEIEYLDGNYQKYGAGATQLIIHQFDAG